MPLRRLIVAILVICALGGTGVPRAAAQQLMPLIPDPITTPDLKPIIDTLGLSNQQTLTLLQLHDAYKERYMQFEDTDVKQLQDQLVEIGLRFTRGRFEIPERKELEAIIEKFKRLLDKSHSFDREFFTQIGSMLSDEQMPRLDRARINRELKVYREILSGVGEMNRGAGVNMAEMVRGLDLSPQEREQIEPSLASYESALLSKSHNIYNVLADAAKVVLDVIDQLNIRNMPLEQLAMLAQNPDTINTLQGTFDTASKPIQQAAWEVSELNLHTYRNVAPLLNAERLADLRDRYFRRAYREIYQGPPPWMARCRAALKLDELTADQRAAIEPQRDSSLSQLNAVIDNAVNILQASRQYKTFKQFSGQETDPAKEKLDEAVARCKSINDSALAALNSALGETMVATLDEKLKKKPQEGGQRVSRSRNNGDASGAADVQVEMVQAEMAAREAAVAAREAAVAGGVIETEFSRYLPKSMDVKQYQQVLTTIGLGEDDRSVAMTIFESYRSDFDKLRGTEFLPRKDNANNASTNNKDNKDSKPPAPPSPSAPPAAGPTPAETAKALATRQDELAALDKRLFDDVALLLHDDAAKKTLDLLRAARIRTANSEVTRSMTFSFGDEEAYIDLVALTLSGDLTPETRTSARAALSDYDARISPHMQARLEAAREVARRFESMQRANRGPGGGPGMRAGGPGGGGPGGGGAGGGAGGQAAQFAVTKWQEARHTLKENNDKVIALNRELLDQIASALSSSGTADAGWQFKLAYNSAAYPDIFRDERGAEKVIQGALALPDLADHQRDQINQVATQYRGDFYGLCEEMVSLRRERNIDFLGGQMPKKEDADREISLEKMRFRRDELSARAKMNLSLILTDEQAKVLPGLQLR